jgi:hypothetical protein
MESVKTNLNAMSRMQLRPDPMLFQGQTRDVSLTLILNIITTALAFESWAL